MKTPAILLRTILLVCLITISLVVDNCYCASNEQIAKTVITNSRGAASIAFSPDGKYLASGNDNGIAINIWDPNTGNELHTFRGHSSPFAIETPACVHSVVFNHDGKLLASGGNDNNLIVWDTVKWEKLIALNHPAPVTSVAFTPDGKLLASSSGPQVTIWDTTTWTKAKELVGHKNLINSVVFSGREKLLASGSADRTIIVWDIVTGQKLFILDGRSRQVQSVDISPDGKSLASGGNFPNLILWDLNNGEQLKLIPSLEGMILSAKFNRDNDTLVLGFKNGSVTFFNRKTGIRRTETVHKRNEVNSVAFSLDGKMAATADSGGKIVIWDMDAITSSLAKSERPLVQPY